MQKPRRVSIPWLLILLLMTLGLSVQAQLSDVTQPGDPIVGTSNNTPGSEVVANVIDNQPTKYLNFDKLNTGFTVTPRVGLTIVQCISLTSANDAIERDPASFVLLGSNDNGTNFVEIASGSVTNFTTRFQRMVICFDNSTPYLMYRLVFPTVANEAAANSMQISEVELLGFLAPTDVTQPGDPIVGTSNNTPGSEVVANAIDNQPTKYLNFDKLNTGFTVTPNVGGTLVSGLTLTSANDGPERDPSSYELLGSLDGTNFFPIASGAVPAFPARFYKNYIFFDNTRAFRSYRLIFPTVANEAAANSMQISEVELLGVVSDLPQDVTQPGDPIVGTSNNTPGSEVVANAIDNQPTKYLNFDKLNTGFTVTPRSGLTIVSGLTLTSANDAQERDPASYVLEGSYNNSNFVQIATGSVPAFTNRFQKQTILFDNDIPYLHYRLVFPTVANEAAANSMQISEVELLGVLAPTDVTVPGDPIVGTSNNTPGSEVVANSIDNQPTKYLNFDKLNTGFTVTPGVGDTIVSGISLTSANDGPERDPASYVLSGSLDGSNYVQISSGPVDPFPARFFKQYIFFPDNKTAFKSYRLVFPTVANEAAANSMQISEVELLGITPGVINTNPVNDLIVRQPKDAPVLVGSPAIFRVGLSGPWKVQWYRNGIAIPGASTATYTTPAATLADDGAIFYAVIQSPNGVQTSDEAMLSIFAPSPTESLGFNFVGSGANGAPTPSLPNDITGFHPQAYWNNLTGGSGTVTGPTDSNNQPEGGVTVTWATSGEWGVGTGNSDPTERLFNGIVTSGSTSESSAQTVTLSGVPAGNHSLFLYTVQVPQEFFNMNFDVITHGAGGVDVVQRRFIRPQNAEEYNAAPGFSLVTSETAGNREVGNFMRFDNLSPGTDGIIAVRFYSPGRVDLPGGDPIRGPGLNALQLVLNPAAVGAPPVIVQQPVSANGIAGGQVTLFVQATGPNLSYEWLRNGQTLAGETNAQLVLSNLETNNAGNYTVIISNPAGRVASRTAVVGVVASPNITFGLITYFKLDEESGSQVASNSAPGGLPGEVRSGFYEWGPGQINNSLLSDDGVTHIYVPNYPKVSRAITVAGWVNSSGTWGPIINNWVEGPTTGVGGQFFVDVVLENGVPVLRGQIEVGPNRVLASGPIDATIGTWHHFAMSANGLSLSIYWDGELISTVDYVGNINVAPAVPWLAIGASFLAPAAGTDPQPDPATVQWTGAMDDIAVWNRSLSGIELLGIYNAGLQAIDISQVPPVLNINRSPVATDIMVSSLGAPVTINVLENSSDPDTNDVVTLTSITQPAHGSAAINPDQTVTYAPTPGYAGADSFNFTIGDGHGGIDIGTVRITVTPSIKPTLACPTNLVRECTGEGTRVKWLIAAVDSASNSIPVICTPPSATIFPVGQSNVVCVATDQIGNSNTCEFVVTVQDTSSPTVTCPADIVAECSGGAGTTVPYVVTAVDACGGTVTPNCTPASGSVFPRGQTTVNCSASDAGSNQVTCSFRVTVMDRTLPVVNCPTNIVVAAGNASNGVATWTVSATDACEGTVAVTCVPASGSTFPVGTNSVVCTAQDSGGRTASCTFAVIVRAGDDEEEPDNARAIKRECLQDLKDLRDNTQNNKQRQIMADAIKHLGNSLEPELWIDGDHLKRKRGDDVFRDEKRAINSLLDLGNNPNSQPNAAVRSILECILSADRRLATIAVEDARGVRPRTIRRAEDLIEQGDDQADRGKYERALESYRSAWNLVTQVKIKAKGLAGGTMSLELTGDESATYVIETSTNLADWSPLGPVTTDEEGVAALNDKDAANHATRFYRLQEPQSATP